MQAPNATLKLVATREGRAISAYLNAYGYAARAIYSKELSTISVPKGYKPGQYATYTSQIPGYLKAVKDGVQRGDVRFHKASVLLSSLHL